MANGSVSLGPFFFFLPSEWMHTFAPYFSPNGGDVGLERMFFFLSLLSLWCDVHVRVQMLVVPVVIVASLQLKVFFSFSHPNFSAASHLRRKGDAHTDCLVQ